MPGSNSEATLLVVFQEHHEQPIGTRLGMPYSLHLIVGGQNGTIYEELTVDCRDFGRYYYRTRWTDFMDLFLSVYFSEVPALVAYDVNKTLPDFSSELQRVDLDALKAMADGFEALRATVPVREVRSARDVFENYMFFRTVFHTAEAAPPLATWEMATLYNQLSEESNRHRVQEMDRYSEPGQRLI